MDLNFYDDLSEIAELVEQVGVEARRLLSVVAVQVFGGL